MNRLSHETSPYLLQHQDNPVDWFPWGPEAFQKALNENKPILLSIGYSTCHWCHVMAHESFEDETVAGFMNTHFVNIKVDREERPDVDAVYMSAVQATTGSGGWPMTVFLDAQGRPFYAGTYFPPRDAHGMPSFSRVLAGVAQAWNGRRQDLMQNAETLTQHLQSAGRREGSEALPADFTARGLAQVRKLFDARHGGFGSAPKFPAPTTLAYLLTQPQARDISLTTLQKMAAGGLYDQLGGGFHRYSVDERWLVPHFEKMLYDNAQLARVYLQAYQLTGEASFTQFARETLEYLEREMLSPEGGFYSAQDADSEGIEGKFFVWTPQELQAILGDDAALAARFWGVTAEGNFMDPHHPDFGRRSVLSVVASPTELAEQFGLSEPDVRRRLEAARRRLWEERELRVHPGTDTKVLTSWNGLALGAFALAARVLREERFLDVARRNADFVRSHLRSEDATLRHSYKDGQARVQGLLEDHALYALGLIELYQASGHLPHLEWARELWNVVATEFWDQEGGAFWSTSARAETLITRQKDAFDSAVMSDNAAAALLGLWMGRYYGDPRGEELATRTIGTFAADMLAAPSGFGGLWQAHALLTAPHVEVAVLGSSQARAPFEAELARHFLPFAALAPSEAGSGLPVLEGRSGEGVAYVCRNFACDLPARDTATLGQQLNALTQAR
ncbi:thioredoxin domain-containing protein [Deinococcus peraridilitoris]|uniref:Thioredoxin domain protein n=1 Tax=Deinococcus peraridilitoris (strain DSM 19664 / LMG 22246 / CIP 109416 / KR-200) TaxID=937777 RepID=K9ZVY9_DEIPD|nr:thioredoxin domain-containing protein [Deinococcus peraridilitoris]AFZ65716.1 thioredoxin domain protein [Deinococcus peraridilitoris DSM 19664]